MLNNNGSTLRRILKESLKVSGADRICHSVYIFGSWLSTFDAQDIDLLFIYFPIDKNSYKYALNFRRVISIEVDSKMKSKADLVLLTVEEERELDYIKAVKGVKVV